MDLQLTLTPAGRLAMIDRNGAETAGGAAGSESRVLSGRAVEIAKAFAAGPAEGLLALAVGGLDPAWPLPWIFWREFASRYLLDLCHLPPDTQALAPLPEPSVGDLIRLVLRIPPMPGAEYCTPETLGLIWADLDTWVREAVAGQAEGLAGFLKKQAPLWRQVGRVCFHLAENKGDPDYPFAFLATYVNKPGKTGRLQHQPLGQALNEYAGARNKAVLLRLLEPVHAASTRCAWVRDLVDSGDLYHPLVWTADEAYGFLKSVPDLEASGLVARLPDWWKKRPRPQARLVIGNARASGLGAAELLDFQAQLTLDGQALTEAEIAGLMAGGDGLRLLRGQWIEVDGEKLGQALDHWRRLEAEADQGGLSFSEGMRLLAGARRDLSGAEDSDDEENGWAFVEAGDWLRGILAGLRAPDTLAGFDPGVRLKAVLRPYQRIGLNWLRFLSELGLGACLADDMGLGKTIQVIALLLTQQERKESNRTSLLVLPASLLSNWQAEIKRFAPGLKILCPHPSEMARAELLRMAAAPAKALAGVDAVLTTYGMLLRQPWLLEQTWNLIVLDEAQAIKTPGTRQTKAVKALKGRARLALTGTPIENRLSDLWSLFDFLCPGLLGSASRFKNFVASLEKPPHPSYAPLRKLVQPYILRRMKTDKRIIDDLPEKTEMTAWCGLAKAQVGLYSQAVRELALALEGQDGIKRRGLVLSYLMRFKQICNHPSQAAGGEYSEDDSGKFGRLREIAEEIAARQEKVLIFTQFREMTGPLAAFLASIFGRSGLVLHGGTPVKERQGLVDRFQRPDGPPFFVLSLKAAGVGLNLTAASHVIHFDRWWNPAVENQATDRAFRIGQKQNVVVHKFVCRGTVEEKIDALIAAKTELAGQMLEGGGETLLTEMDNEALLGLVALDMDKAVM